MKIETINIATDLIGKLSSAQSFRERIIDERLELAPDACGTFKGMLKQALSILYYATDEQRQRALELAANAIRVGLLPEIESEIASLEKQLADLKDE